MSEEQTEYNKSIYEKAVIKWGVDAQIDMLIEEMAELIVSLKHMKRGRIHNVPDEFADVEIVMEQLRPYFNKENVIDTQKALKIKRLEERVGMI